tara:strand:- start:105 stop:650 length:546 start_codon:yes stop_codon:yes gene_type:complete
MNKTLQDQLANAEKRFDANQAELQSTKIIELEDINRQQQSFSEMQAATIRDLRKKLKDLNVVYMNSQIKIAAKLRVKLCENEKVRVETVERYNILAGNLTDTRDELETVSGNLADVQQKLGYAEEDKAKLNDENGRLIVSNKLLQESRDRHSDQLELAKQDKASLVEKLDEIRTIVGQFSE